jgi:hypothetical protein
MGLKSAYISTITRLKIIMQDERTRQDHGIINHTPAIFAIVAIFRLYPAWIGRLEK